MSDDVLSLPGHGKRLGTCTARRQSSGPRTGRRHCTMKTQFRLSRETNSVSAFSRLRPTNLHRLKEAFVGASASAYSLVPSAFPRRYYGVSLHYIYCSPGSLHIANSSLPFVGRVLYAPTTVSSSYYNPMHQPESVVL